jgi:hypothetical protein
VILKINKNSGCLQPCEERTAARWGAVGTAHGAGERSGEARPGRAQRDVGAIGASEGVIGETRARKVLRGTARTFRRGAVGVGDAPVGGAGEREKGRGLDCPL